MPLQYGRWKATECAHAFLRIKSRYGKNAIIKGMDLLEEGNTIARNSFIGGYKAGSQV